MRVVMFYHSLLSDWNHGNAHFLRGVATELQARGVDVGVYEPVNSWSLQNLLAEHGEAPIKEFRRAYPFLESIQYDPRTLNLDGALDGADLVLVHEWNDHDLVRRIGEHRARARQSGYRLLFHDTHHRAVTDRQSMAAYDLRHYDGVLAFGEVIRHIYLAEGWTARAWTWHEAADTRVFHPRRQKTEDRRQNKEADHKDSSGSCLLTPDSSDLVWIGNWGDEERTAELHEFLIQPIKELGLKARVYGVRYPETARATLAEAGIEYAGWLPNYKVPEVFAQAKVTVHIPRRPYVESLPGIPTIRLFEALACGIPLVCSPWDDVEGLFTPGRDFLIAQNGEEMTGCLKLLLEDERMRDETVQHGLRTVLDRHTCAHRVDELLGIYAELESLRSEEVMTA